MEWLNIHSSTLSSDEFLDSPADDQAAWVLISSYCANQENGGRITGAKLWDDQKCMRALKVPRDRLKDQAFLWSWEGDDLLIAFYPIEQEEILRKKRGGAALGGRLRGAQLKAQAQATKPDDAKAEGEPMAKGLLKRKGREGKGKKGNGRVRESGSLSGVSGSDVPSEADVRAWATSSGVDPDFALQKRAEVCERHGWFQNGRLIDWQSRFKRFWESDRSQWEAFRKKSGAAAWPARGGSSAPGLPAEALPTDCAWWWSDAITNVEATFAGALLQGDEKIAARLREVLAIRKKGSA
jgi:hypothetical protein